MFESFKRILQKPNPYPLGSDLNPVRCDGVMGEHAYLKRLRDPNGRAITYTRVGSFGKGPAGNIMDGYKLINSQGEESFIYMDMYDRKHIETTAPIGFFIANWSVASFKGLQGTELDAGVMHQILQHRLPIEKCQEIIMFTIVWSSKNGDASTDELEETYVRQYGLDAETARIIGGFVAGY